MFALPFLTASPKAYIGGAFDLSRRFLHKWTVNWKFIPEETFLSREFAVGLLALHLLALLLFFFSRWLGYDFFCITTYSSNSLLRMTINSLIGQGSEDEENTPSNRNLLAILYTCTHIGALFARSLHYQFYSWIYWSTPFLLWQTGLPLPLQGVLWITQEIAWNIYPSTPLSSFLTVVSLLLPVLACWYNNVDESRVETYGRLQREARIREGLKVD